MLFNVYGTVYNNIITIVNVINLSKAIYLNTGIIVLYCLSAPIIAQYCKCICTY